MHQILSEGFVELGLSVSDDALLRFRKYYEFLTERNSVMNLTAINGEEDTARLHFLDCAALAAQYGFGKKKVIDIGSGAGFPGIPLKLIHPDMSLTLLDSHQKRVNFLRETCELLDLDKVQCVCSRAEELSPEERGSYDIVVSRAVARLRILCELCLPFVSPGGAFIAMKGPACEDELNEAQNAIRILGGTNPEIKYYTVPGTGILHSAVVIHKHRPTPPNYPRQFGRIKKAPL